WFVFDLFWKRNYRDVNYFLKSIGSFLISSKREIIENDMYSRISWFVFDPFQKRDYRGVELLPEIYRFVFDLFQKRYYRERHVFSNTGCSLSIYSKRDIIENDMYSRIR